VLKGAGYATAAFSAANPYISSRFGYEQGFDTFRDFLECDPVPPQCESNAENGNRWAARLNRKLQAARSTLGPLGSIYDDLYFQYCQRTTPVAGSLDALRRFPAADVIVDHACSWLSSVGNVPCFLWLHLMDPHSPYYPKDAALALMEDGPVTPFRARYLNSYWNRSDVGAGRLARHRDEIVALYDAGIRWVDTQMARLIESMRESKRWENCIFAFTADHGEEFLDHSGRYHPPSRLTEELVHVPLLLRVPGVAKREVTKSSFSMLHLAPTLLQATKLSAPAAFQGRSFWEQLQRGGDFDVAITECVADCTNPFRREKRVGPRLLSVRESRFKLVLQFDPVGEHLYDLEEDPSESAPLASTAMRPVRRRLLEIARDHLRRSREHLDWKMRVQSRLRELQLEWKKTTDKASPVAS
jgi:arylsulfatase A-like enzyme